MAVYTSLDAASVDAALRPLGVGALLALTPIAGGIENTNYFVDTEGGRWVLTVFERLGTAELPYYLALMRHLAAQGLPVPAPCAAPDGALMLPGWQGKPAALVNRLPGASLDAPDLHHVAQLGHTLARMHRAVDGFTHRQPNLRGRPWREATAGQVRPWLDGDDAALLDAEIQHQAQLLDSAAAAGLPRGAVHADLFRDNALFDGLPGRERLSGVFDFYFAGDDHFTFDLAVVLNDWCIDLDSGRLDEARAQALVQAYRQERPLSGAELRLLPGLRRTAALRFWLSRLADWHLPRPASLLTPKPPDHFARVLRDCVRQPWHPEG